MRFPPRRALPSALVLLLALVLPRASGQTTDRIVTRSGTITGRIVATDTGEVQVEDRNGETKQIPVDQIREVQFGGEPQELKSARSMLLRGRPADAVEELAKMQAGDLDGAEQILLDDRALHRQRGGARHRMTQIGVSVLEGARTGFDRRGDVRGDQ